MGHVDALHAKAHCCALHVWLLEQLAHVAPPVPHALVEVPAWHTLPTQQPDGHVVELHVEGVTQVWPVHVWLLEQLAHVAPPWPHAELEVPAMHTFPEQHPLGHVVALHVEPPTHEPAEQLWLGEQLAQAAPPIPHAAVEVPERQTPSWQHPEGHVVALQVELVPVHCRVSLEQVCAEPHAEQRAPPVPQNEVVVPVRHTEPSQHPSGHVLASQVPELEMHCRDSLPQIWFDPHVAHA